MIRKDKPIMSKVTVVIPTFNCARYICQAIDSVLKQNYRNLEIIVVDDGSTDDTRETVAPYVNDGSIRYTYQDNLGLPGARNTGISMAGGEYVALLDADDEIDERMISLCVEKVERENTDWCIVDLLRITSSPSGEMKEMKMGRIPEGNLLHEMLADDYIPRSALFKKSCLDDIGCYHDDIQIRVDWEINIRLLRAGKRFSHVKEPVYIYKIREDSLVKKVHKKKYDQTLGLLRKHHKQLADQGDREVAAIYAQNLWRLARAYMVEVHAMKAGLSCVYESMKYDFSVKRLFHPFYHHLVRRSSY
ncbi:glycosyltransferase family 2 protein [Candidatus Moduliflexota bacterium]